MTHRTLLALLTLLFVTACAAPPMPPPSDAVSNDVTPPTGPRTFTLAIANDDLVMSRGERITIDVRVVRSGGFAEPVLVDLAGLPDALRTQARESRPGDSVTTLTIVCDEESDPIERAAFVVQASTIDGLRQSAPAHVTIR